MYFITGMTNIVTEYTPFTGPEMDAHSTRCFGYFQNEQEAVEAVTRNAYDMWEGCYHYILIEQIGEGIHATAKDIGWFAYDKASGTYMPTQVARTGFCNYALG